MAPLRITIPAAMFGTALARLSGGAARVEIVGGFHDGDRPEFIACETPPPRPIRAQVSLEGRFAHPATAGIADDTRLVLEIGRDSRLGRARAWVRTGDGWTRAGELFLPGPRMVRVALGPAVAPPAVENERWSRTRGALGAAAHDRLRSLRVGIAGLGRLGCVLARNFAGLGVAALALVDPDHVELHNTGEGGFFGEADIGQLKVHAWENSLAVHHPEIEVAACASSVSLASAQQALAACDLIVSATDHPAARILAAATAAAFARPLLDVGTQVLSAGGASAGASSAGATMGLDARYLFPGRCLLCFGGVGPEEAVARRIIESPDFERELQSGRDGLAERPGSLHSLNQLAAGYEVRMVEDGLSGRLAGHTWRREEFLPDGRSRSAYHAPVRGAAPCLCRLAGWGVAAAPQVLTILDARAALAPAR